MSHRKWSRVALAIAPILALAACDQAASLWDRLSGQQQETAGPAPLDDVPIDARAISGAVQSQADVAALLAPEPIMIAPGEIIVGARVESELAESAQEMNLAGSLVRSSTRNSRRS